MPFLPSVLLHRFTWRALLLAGLFASTAVQAADIIFWDVPRHGGNSFNQVPPDRAHFDALRATGATWVRLSCDKWPAHQRDFLIGNADDYRGLDAADLKLLRRVLDDAHASGLKVVLAPLSLPLLRWSQNNGGEHDPRLWQSLDAQQPALAFWHDLAAALAGHPALAAYNLINEPAPERDGVGEHASAAALAQWYARVKGTGRDLPAFYTRLIAAVRRADPTTPIMLDAGWYAAADAFSYWPAALKDPALLYSVHMYEPYAATSAPNQKRATPYGYPGTVPFGSGEQAWDAARVREYLMQPLVWADARGIPRTRMVVGEFGCMRRWSGCPAYLHDVLAVLDDTRVHWAFYAFREDAWDGMDYELGDGPLPWTYWKAAEAGKVPSPPRRETPLFAPILKRLRASP